MLKLPYHSLDRVTELSRLSADIAYIDKSLIKAVSPCMGLFNQMTQLYFAAIAHELRELNITHYTLENEQRLITIIRRRTATITNRKTSARHVRDRIKRAHLEITRTFKQFTDYQNKN